MKVFRMFVDFYTKVTVTFFSTFFALWLFTNVLMNVFSCIFVRLLSLKWLLGWKRTKIVLILAKSVYHLYVQELNHEISNFQLISYFPISLRRCQCRTYTDSQWFCVFGWLIYCPKFNLAFALLESQIILSSFSAGVES